MEAMTTGPNGDLGDEAAVTGIEVEGPCAHLPQALRSCSPRREKSAA